VLGVKLVAHIVLLVRHALLFLLLCNVSDRAIAAVSRRIDSRNQTDNLSIVRVLTTFCAHSLTMHSTPHTLSESRKSFRYLVPPFDYHRRPPRLLHPHTHQQEACTALLNRLLLGRHEHDLYLIAEVCVQLSFSSAFVTNDVPIHPRSVDRA
jgi:hypothetical protein